jgi:hypothetical protein
MRYQNLKLTNQWSIVNNKSSLDISQKGQALITLLFFMIIGITLIVAASVVTLGNVASTGATEQGTIAYYAAENGIEDALLQLLRYPCALPTGAYPACPAPNGSGTTTLSYMQGSLTASAVVTVTTSGSTLTITSTGTYANAIRKIQVQETNGSSGWTVDYWKEIN